MNKILGVMTAAIVVGVTLLFAGCLESTGAAVDCGTDLECFSTYAENCTPAYVTMDLGELMGAFGGGTGDLEGFELEYYYEIKGGTLEECAFYMKVNRFRLPAGTEGGAEATAMMEGKDMTCTWSVTEISSGMTDPTSESLIEDCTGSLIAMISQSSGTSSPF